MLFGCWMTSVGFVAVSAQQPPAETNQARLSPEAAAVKKANDTKKNEVLATVNGDKITRGELVQFFSKFQLPENFDPQVLYKSAIDTIANTKLVMQQVKAAKVSVAAAEIDTEIENLKTALKEQKAELAQVLAESGRTLEEVRSDMEQFLLWKKYITGVATDATLNKYIADNKEIFNGDQVRASHILVKVAADATPEAKEAAKKKLLDIKQQIGTGKMTFAEAANKHSEDEGNAEKVGGDLGFFYRKGQFIEPFAAAAFGLKKGQISDVVESPFGYHLIQLTDRKDGQPQDPNNPNLRAAALDAFAQERQEQLVLEARKKAVIEVKPMPGDLFPPAPAAAPAAKPAK